MTTDTVQVHLFTAIFSLDLHILNILGSIFKACFLTGHFIWVYDLASDLLQIHCFMGMQVYQQDSGCIVSHLCLNSLESTSVLFMQVRIAVFSQHHVDGLDLSSNPLLYMMRCFPVSICRICLNFPVYTIELYKGHCIYLKAYCIL